LFITYKNTNFAGKNVMEQIIINIEDKTYGELLLKLLKELNFVKGITVTNTGSLRNKLPDSKFISKSDFWDTFGTGKDTSIDINFIKNKAWRTPNL